MNLSILYRGPLSSCNYRCSYCPFAKRRESRAQLATDRAALERFVGWVSGYTNARLGVLFTPWGEALVRSWYREALITLTHLPHVAKVAVQTNLACGLDWIERCDKNRLALWCTFHPTETVRRRFVAKCLELDRRGVRFSVGAVGVKAHESDIRALRDELPPHIYLWVNAIKSHPRYYADDDVRRLEQIDPLFRINLRDYKAAGRRCLAGESVVSIDGDGTIRRCHFIRDPIGNIYEGGMEAALAPRPCTNALCRCHIGYVNMPELGLERVFEDGVLERVPVVDTQFNTLNDGDTEHTEKTKSRNTELL